jgi:hypothetical protein
MFVFWLICVYFQTFGKEFNGIWLEEIREYADLFDTFRRELFTVDYWIHDNETPKTGLLRLCLFINKTTLQKIHV